MGADLFESFVGAILATIVLGAAVGLSAEGAEATQAATGLLAYPLALATMGILASFVGTFRVTADPASRLQGSGGGDQWMTSGDGGLLQTSSVEQIDTFTDPDND